MSNGLKRQQRAARQADDPDPDRADAGGPGRDRMALRRMLEWAEGEADRLGRGEAARLIREARQELRHDT